MKISLMIEGQEDVSWSEWRAIAALCELYGYDTLFRSDHYASVQDPGARGSLDAWGTVCGLASMTSSIRLGVLVSPVTFRHPSLLAKLAVTADHISNGRIELGLGLGWFEGDFKEYGFPFPTLADRTLMLEEQLEIITRQWAGEGFAFDGRHYHLADNRALPRPVQSPHPPIIIGGSGRRESIRLAARWADEYNTLEATPADCEERRRTLDAACRAIGRDPRSVRLSLLIPCVVGGDRRSLRDRAREVLRWIHDPDPTSIDDLLASDRWLIGTPKQVLRRLHELEDAGVDRVMVQHFPHRDIDTIELIGTEVLPEFAAN